MGLYKVWTIQALGDLELGLGRPAEAVEHHEAQAAALRSRGIADVDLSPAPELVDAYLRLGRGEEAAAAAREFVAAAEAKGQPWALARAARCRGLLAEPGELEAEFEAGAPAARADAGRLRDGAHAAGLRGAAAPRADARARTRAAAAAVELFERLGAQPWADQARVELAATGETARRRDSSTLDDLTPQELQIAQLLAGGQDDARGGRGGLPEPEDRRVPPPQRLPQAGDPLARGACRRLRRAQVSSAQALALRSRIVLAAADGPEQHRDRRASWGSGGQLGTQVAQPVCRASARWSQRRAAPGAAADDHR